MQLSQTTINTLKNFAAINPNLVFKSGNVIKTIATAKNILATATVEESFPQEFGIYDLNEFLSVMSLFDAPTLDFSNDGKSVRVRDAGGRSSVNYFFSDASILTAPTKDLTMPKTEVSFELSDADMSMLRRAASTLGAPNVVVIGVEGESNITLQVTDVSNPTVNTFEIKLDDNVTRPEGNFSLVFSISNFKITGGDYIVSLSSKLISHFKNKTSPVEYWIALEKSSTFNA